MTKRTRSEPKKAGRPAGVENYVYDIVDVVPTRCKKCRSTERIPYFGRNRVHKQEFTGKIVITTWKRTRCLNCRQHRMDKFVEEKTVKSPSVAPGNQ